MNESFPQSLSNLAISKTVVYLWVQNLSWTLKERCCFIYSSKRVNWKQWQVFEEKMLEKAKRLPLPKAVKLKILSAIQSIGLEILKWIGYHEWINPHSGIQFLNNLCWTSQQTVDKKKTAELLIKDHSLPITTRYQLACLYCLENDILMLWITMPENSRNNFYSAEGPNNVKQEKLVLFWTYQIKGKVDQLYENLDAWNPAYSFNQNAFQCAAKDGNEVATRYFFLKLTPIEQEESLVETAECVAGQLCFYLADIPISYHTSIFCYLLSQLGREEQRVLFERSPYKMMACLLDWPGQSFFMEMVNRLWDSLSGWECGSLLRSLVIKMTLGHKDYYRNIFEEFWLQIPSVLKEDVLRICSDRIVLSNLFKINDRKTLQLIFNDITISKKKELMYSDAGKSICVDLIFEGQWGELEFFIRECISSTNDVMKIKKELEWSAGPYLAVSSSDKKRELDKFFQLLDMEEL